MAEDGWCSTRSSPCSWGSCIGNESSSAPCRGSAHAHTRGRLACRDLLVAELPFELTGAQRRACDEVARDMTQPYPMHRLVEGEVGSGKTVVALYACLTAIDGGYQAAFMAPTEVLAEQHSPDGERAAGQGVRRPRSPQPVRGGASQTSGRSVAHRSTPAAQRERDPRRGRRGRGRPLDRNARADPGRGRVRAPGCCGRRRAAPVRRSSAEALREKGVAASPTSS